MTRDLEELLDNLNRKTAELDLAGISTQTAAMMVEIQNTGRILSETIDSPEFRRMIQDAGGSFSSIQSLVADIRDPMTRTLEDLSHAAASAKTLTRDLEERTDTRINELSRQMDGLMKTLNNTVAMLENLVWLNSDTINRTINNFEHTSENLKQMSLEIRRYPARLLLERPPKPSQEPVEEGK
jgi:ABC-type transporter Mla subunit MlaD